MTAHCHWFVPVQDYDLSLTLSSGQAFRWSLRQGWWEGVLRRYWVRLRQRADGLEAETAEPVSNWGWLEHYLQVHVDLKAVLATFPEDPHLQAAVAACRGLRLLRQDPWECLASFILSSTKQIAQIQQVVAALCARFGDPVTVPPGHEPSFAFPAPARLARASEAKLRACKVGFRAGYLRAAAQAVSQGEVALEQLGQRPVEEARAALMRLPGVGEKIANCVLLFAFGFQEAFPVDVWVRRALQQMYFPRRKPSPKELARFTQTYFGPFAGYAQQYLFCYVRAKQLGRQPLREQSARAHWEGVCRLVGPGTGRPARRPNSGLHPRPERS